ncbi:HIRAN domain-containing protein [[Ruminococcus] gnavus]|uniref:HIRAN domain-containing protein n=1 Tax=Mediterraneibacter gnavus TaxID=33038 RepID=A0A9Q4HUJ6_MEDGN|nr:HIRAN domain-containing protein [Mediterraneibacter gnavus]MCZ0667474.1 HIRAN domain-containing protein [Mediterraneibacter gnavus]
MSKIGLFGKLFTKKDNPVSPDPVVSAPSKPVIPTKTDNFKVAGISSYMDNLMELAYENDDYEKTKKQIVDDFMYDEKIFQYDFLVSKVELIPEPENEYDSNAVKVVVDGVHIGYIKKGSCSRVKNLLSSGRVTDIDCSIFGGKYKVVWDRDEGYVLEEDEYHFGATVEITYKLETE